MVSKKDENILKGILDVFGFLFLCLIYIGQSLLKLLLPSSYAPKKELKGEIVLITGGGGGLGRLLALRLARLKAVIVLWDVNEKGKFLSLLNILYKILI